MDLNEAEKYSKEINAIFGETSPLKNCGIEELFRCIGNKYLEEMGIIKKPKEIFRCIGNKYLEEKGKTKKPKKTDYPNKFRFINKLKKYLSL